MYILSPPKQSKADKVIMATDTIAVLVSHFAKIDIAVPRAASVI